MSHLHEGGPVVECGANSIRHNVNGCGKIFRDDRPPFHAAESDSPAGYPSFPAAKATARFVRDLPRSHQAGPGSELPSSPRIHLPHFQPQNRKGLSMINASPSLINQHEPATVADAVLDGLKE